MSADTETMTPIRLIALLLMLVPCLAQGSLTVVDERGNTITLARPAQRIISLSPHITELLFAAGAGDRIAGVAAYSDYPEKARSLPVIGGFQNPDYERIIALRPELIVAWSSGNGPQVIGHLRKLGYPVYESEPRRLEDIASDIEKLGRLAGTHAHAQATSRDFRERMQSLADNYRDREPVSVFYQVWHQPLMTVNGEQIISRVIELCGGRNIFAKLPSLAPTVDMEAVIRANPQVIIASGRPPASFIEWNSFAQLQAVQNRRIHTLDADLINRATPRLLTAAEQLCHYLDQARSPHP